MTMTLVFDCSYEAVLLDGELRAWALKNNMPNCRTTCFRYYTLEHRLITLEMVVGEVYLHPELKTVELV